MNKKFSIRIHNTMFGYERDQVVEIEAESLDAAIKKASNIDCFADITVVSSSDV